jgi:uncharacterized membrane protein
MTNREKIEIAGVALVVGGVGWLSVPWAMVVLGTLILTASVAGRALQCYRQ